MFAQLHTTSPRGRNARLYGSVSLHCVLLYLLVRSPGPVFVAPASVVRGVPNGSVTQLYWTGRASEPHLAGGSTAAKSPLTWKQREQRAKGADNVPTQADETRKAGAREAPAAGSAYGSLSEGPAIGYEIRPALPVYALDPVLGPSDLAHEGDEVVEITIDEAGNVIQTNVLQSLGPAVDAKVLAVLQGWRFHPATRDGLAIASKQDVHYHFKPHS
jgi:TonB family protein